MRIIKANNLGVKCAKIVSHVNKRIKHRDPVPALINSSGITITSDKN